MTEIASWPTSTIRPANTPTSSITCERWPGVRRDAHQQQLGLAGLVGMKLADLDDVYELVQLRHDLLERSRLDVHDDRDPGETRVVGGRDSKREDVVATAREQPRDAGEHAGLVLDQDREQAMTRSVVPESWAITTPRILEDAGRGARRCRRWTPRRAPSGTPAPSSRSGSRSPPAGRRCRSPSRWRE